MSFNVPVLKNRIRRVVLNYNDISASSPPLRYNHRRLRRLHELRAHLATATGGESSVPG